MKNCCSTLPSSPWTASGSASLRLRRSVSTYPASSVLPDIRGPAWETYLDNMGDKYLYSIYCYTFHNLFFLWKSVKFVLAISGAKNLKLVPVRAIWQHCRGSRFVFTWSGLCSRNRSRSLVLYTPDVQKVKRKGGGVETQLDNFWL